MVDANNFFTKEHKQQIVEAIQEAEKNTSGEIRLHVENTCQGDVLDRSVAIFEKLGMKKTEARNGVLFYLAVKSKQFAVIGDKGINQVVETDFWKKIKSTTIEDFKSEKFAEGLCKAILKCGEQLKAHFPYTKSDKNELSDDVSFKNN